MMTRNDFALIVIGSGIVGLSTAVAAAKAKVGPILCLDMHGVANPFGASGDGLRLFRLSYFEHPSYVPLLRQAIENWNALGDGLYIPAGGFYAGPPDSDLIKGSLESAELHGIKHVVLNSKEASNLFPNFVLPSEYVAFIESEGGYVHAAKATNMMARMARSRQVAVSQDTVKSISPIGSRWAVEGESNTYWADQIVVASGYQTSTLVPSVGLSLKKETHLLLWLQESSENDWTGIPGFGVMNEAGEMLYGFPAVDEVRGVKIGGHHQFSSGDIDNQELGLKRLANQFLPSLSGKVLSRKTCDYDMSPDGHFMIGQIEQGLTVACGFSGHGYKFGSVIGDVVWQAATDGLPNDLAFLDVNRFTSTSGLT